MDINSFQIRNLEPSDVPQLRLVQVRYAQCYPTSWLLPPENDSETGLVAWQGNFGAFDQDGSLLGFACIYPAMVRGYPRDDTHRLFAEIKIDPSQIGRDLVGEALLSRLYQHAGDLMNSLPVCPSQIVFQVFPGEEENLNFLTKHGFIHTESLYILERDLASPIPIVLPPPGMKIQFWRMESEAEQKAYVEARNASFPESTLSLQEWQKFMKTPVWDVGACLAAIDEDELAGCICLFWDEIQNQRSGRMVGSTENLFVLPRWRGIGLGRHLVAQGLAYLKKNGLQTARLEVHAANVGALGLYTRLNYQVKDERWFLVNTL